ncbi:MAG: calcium/sodium antiporter [Phycisphaerales bacterium]|nr:calcium/sodium antiporter [Phycisphaerales bacterium]
MTITLSLLVLMGGIVLLLTGGELLVRGAVTFADRFGVSPLLIGLTVVAFGTSAPELALNTIAAARDQTDLCFGNIVGSNIANIGLILGLTALIRPLTVHSQLIRRELPMMIGASVLLCIFAVAWLRLVSPSDDGPSALFGSFDHAEGMALLLLFVMFFAYQLRVGLRGSRFDQRTSEVTAQDEMREAGERDRVGSLALAGVFFIVGLGLLLLGGDLAGRGAADLAAALGMGQDLIGLTVVALATSLPELATSLAAIRRRQTDIAVGNIIGSNLFNILMVMGVTTTIRPVALPDRGGITLAVMLLLSVLIWPMSRTKSQNISRLEGSVLLAIYAGYMAWSVLTRPGA